MKLTYLLLSLVSLFDITAANAIPLPIPVPSPSNQAEKGGVPHSVGVHHLQSRAINLQAEWSKALCKGVRLTQGMIVDEEKAAEFVTPVRSRWGGDLVQEFRTWGYREVPGARDSRCDFGHDVHELQRAFATMGIDPRPASDGGPNVCYHVEHMYGPAVVRNPDGGWPKPEEQTYRVTERMYRATQAYSTIGVNAASGVLYFLNRLSPYEAAKEEWGVENPQKEELPALRTTSDHAWGFWYRANRNHLGSIKKIMSTMITNKITQALIYHALATYELAPGEKRPNQVMPWPGTTFDSTTDQGDALVGSPNGLAAGYFLAQHKRELGRKYIERVTVFRADTRGSFPNLLFWVTEVPDTDSEEDGSDTGRSASTAGKQMGNTTAAIVEREPRLLQRNSEGDFVVHFGR